MKAPLLIAKTGETLDAVRAQFGDFDAIFGRWMSGVEALMVDAVNAPQTLPPPESIAGVVITGSPHSVTQPAEWTDALAEWIVRAADAGVPTLGVCYGHQLIAYAFGGKVEMHPTTFEIGTINVDVTPAGHACPLMGPVANGRDSLSFQAVHRDVVTRLPEGAKSLAGNAVSPNQAFSLGDHVRGVQFHPEISAPMMSLYVEGRSDLIIESAKSAGTDPDDRLEAVRRSVREEPHGHALLQRFVDHFVLRGK